MPVITPDMKAAALQAATDKRLNRVVPTPALPAAKATALQAGETARMNRATPTPGLPAAKSAALQAGAVKRGMIFKKGGSVSSASKRADGCAQRGKTKGRMV